MRLSNVSQQCAQCLGKYPCCHAQLFGIQRHDVHICCVAEYQSGLSLEFGVAVVIGQNPEHINDFMEVDFSLDHP